MAGTEFKLKAVLGCVDKITPVLTGVRTRIAGMNGLFNRISSSAGAMTKAIAVPLALIGGSSLLSVRRAISAFQAMGDSLDKASQRAGVSVKSLQVLRTAASLGGMQADQMDMALNRLSNTISQSLAGKNKQASQIFNHLGISLRDASGQARSSADVMRDLAEAVKNNNSQSARMQILSATFGNKMAASLIPVLQDGAEHFDKLTASAEQSGLMMTEADVKAAAHLTDTLTKMRGTMTKISASIGARLAPTVDRLSSKITGLLVKNKELIASKLEIIFNRLAEAIDSVDLQQLINGITVVVDVLFTLFDTMGGFTGVAIAFGLILGGKVVLAVMNFMTALKGLFALVTAHPFVAVALAIVYAAMMIYRNWDQLVKWFQETFPALTAVVMALPNAISEAFNAAKAVVQQFFSFLASVVPDWLINLFSGKALPNLQGFSANSAAPVNKKGGNGTLTVKIQGDKNVKSETEYRGNLENYAYGDGYSFYP